jgi:hypothetical protein
MDLLLFDTFLFTCQGISTTNKQQTFDFGEVSEFWGFEVGGGGLLFLVINSNERKKVKASYIGVEFSF